MKLRNILVPTDFGASSTAAFRYAKVLAEQFGAKLHVLHVISAPYYYDAWGTQAIAIQIVDLQRQLEHDTRKQLKALVPTSGPLARRVTTSAVTGTTVESILDYVKAKRADLVVMGTHGRGPVEHVLLGSVAERVVRHSPVPVLTVHGPAARRRKRASKRRARG